MLYRDITCCTFFVAISMEKGFAFVTEASFPCLFSVFNLTLVFCILSQLFVYTMLKILVNQYTGIITYSTSYIAIKK